MEELKDGRFPSFQRCGFDGFIEILCCPESELEYWIQTTTSTSTEETTEQTTTTEAVSKNSNKSPVVDNRELTAAKRKSLLGKVLPLICRLEWNLRLVEHKIVKHTTLRFLMFNFLYKLLPTLFRLMKKYLLYLLL